MKVLMIIEFDLPESMEPVNADEQEYVLNEVLKNDLILHSNYIGDTVSSEIRVCFVDFVYGIGD